MGVSCHRYGKVNSGKRAIRGLLFGVGPWDWVSVAAAVAVLITVAGVAAWVPARRAARVDPLVALKAE